MHEIAGHPKGAKARNGSYIERVMTEVLLNRAIARIIIDSYFDLEL